jgi:hypothetical protein
VSNIHGQLSRRRVEPVRSRRLDTGGSDHPDHEVIDVAVRPAARIPVRPVRLIAEGCGLSRAEVERLITAGKLVSAVRLGGRLSGDFTFTLKR